VVQWDEEKRCRGEVEAALASSEATVAHLTAQLAVQHEVRQNDSSRLEEVVASLKRQAHVASTALTQELEDTRGTLVNRVAPAGVVPVSVATVPIGQGKPGRAAVSRAHVVAHTYTVGAISSCVCAPSDWLCDCAVVMPRAARNTSLSEQLNLVTAELARSRAEVLRLEEALRCGVRSTVSPSLLRQLPFLQFLYSAVRRQLLLSSDRSALSFLKPRLWGCHHPPLRHLVSLCAPAC
jgi:hypothetical protein